MARQETILSMGKKLDANFLNTGTGTLDEYYLTEQERGEGSTDLQQVYAEIDTAQATADTALSTANNAEDAAQIADGKAVDAMAASTTATNTANNAQSTANNAATLAQSASTAATNADNKATTALENAATAQTAANSAQAAANGAQNTANTAQTTASNAATVAANATSTATTANATANSAATAASNAQTTANTAVANAANAQTKADDAYTLANTANNTANTANTTANTANGKADTVLTGLAGKQATLVSGSNIKTVNNQSVLGSGNIEITSGVSADSNNSLSIGTDNKPYLSNWTIPHISLGELTGSNTTYNYNNAPEQSYSYARYIAPTNNPTNAPVTHTANTAYYLEWTPTFGTNSGTMKMIVCNETESKLYKRTRYNNVWVTGWLLYDYDLLNGGSKWSILEKASAQDKNVIWSLGRTATLSAVVPAVGENSVYAKRDMTIVTDTIGCTISSGNVSVPVTGNYIVQILHRVDCTFYGGVYNSRWFDLKRVSDSVLMANAEKQFPWSGGVTIGHDVQGITFGVYLETGQQYALYSGSYTGAGGSVTAGNATIKLIWQR